MRKEEIDLTYEGIATHQNIEMMQKTAFEEIDLTYEGIATQRKDFLERETFWEEIDLTYEGIATWSTSYSITCNIMRRNWPDLRRDCDLIGLPVIGLPLNLEEIDLTYEGIATIWIDGLIILRHSLEEIDLTYEGIATQLQYQS